MAELPKRTSVVVAGGGPVGLVAALELGRRGIDCVVIEPRETVSRARPRCKTLNVRTLEHLRRLGVSDRLRETAPLSAEYSTDVVFCLSLTGHELSRFTGAFGLVPEGDRFPEIGQQAGQYVIEELLREVVAELPTCELVLGHRVTGVEQDDDGATVTVDDEATVRADYVIGCDGPSSVVRESIGARYIGQVGKSPNFGVVFRAPELASIVTHGRAVQYWIVNPFAPGVMGPLNGEDIWWAGFAGVDEERGARDVEQLITYAVGRPVDIEVTSTDPWTANMQLADHLHSGRVFLAGDAAHLNPPFGGYGLNMGIGDAVDIGWKLAAVLEGWAAPGLLDSYEAERRPVHGAVIDEAVANLAVLPQELANPALAADGSSGEQARQRADAKIQETKDREFHSVDFVLGLGYAGSPWTAGAAAGGRLEHRFLADGGSIFDRLGAGFTLLALTGDHAAEISDLASAAQASRLPLRVEELGAEDLRDTYGADLVLVRPDQHVAWRGDELDVPAADLLNLVRGATSPALTERH
jgi:2-polyprenyl-6-methoxyphenol hydroxylase-like FAD-dependent oxidoreductase